MLSEKMSTEQNKIPRLIFTVKPFSKVRRFEMKLNKMQTACKNFKSSFPLKPTEANNHLVLKTLFFRLIKD